MLWCLVPVHMHVYINASTATTCNHHPLQEYVYVEECDVGGGEGGGDGGAVEVPLHDIAESAEQQTPKSKEKPRTPAK